jgi:hypothetical protein
MSRVELDIRLANINVVGKFSPTTDNLIFSSIYWWLALRCHLFMEAIKWVDYLNLSDANYYWCTNSHQLLTSFVSAYFGDLLILTSIYLFNLCIFDIFYINGLYECLQIDELTYLARFFWGFSLQYCQILLIHNCNLCLILNFSSWEL